LCNPENHQTDFFMEDHEITPRLIKHIVESGFDGLDLKVSKIDTDGYITFSVKFSSFADKELADALKSRGDKLPSVIQALDRETIGNAIVSRNLGRFTEIFSAAVDADYESIFSGEHTKFGFGANDKNMSFQMHVNLLYNLYVNSVIE
jgi:hypothetical protein